MSRPITMGDIADIIKAGETISSVLPEINEAQFIGYLKELSIDAALRQKFRSALGKLANTVRILRDAPMQRVKE